MIASRDACKDYEDPPLTTRRPTAAALARCARAAEGADIFLPRKAQPQLFCVLSRAYGRAEERRVRARLERSSSDPANAETCVEAVTGRAVKWRAGGREARTSPQNIERRSRNRADDGRGSNLVHVDRRNSRIDGSTVRIVRYFSADAALSNDTYGNGA